MQKYRFPKISAASFFCLLLMASAAPAALPFSLVPQLLAGELKGEDKAEFEGLLDSKAFKTEDKLMATTYSQLLALMSKAEQSALRDEQYKWNIEKERETVHIMHRKGEDEALQYLLGATEQRRQDLESMMKSRDRTIKELPDSNVKMPSDPAFKKADALMSARYAAYLKDLGGRGRMEFVNEQRNWNLAKEREYLRIKEKSGSSAALTYLIEATLQRAEEIK